jgi:hypothetical protein
MTMGFGQKQQATQPQGYNNQPGGVGDTFNLGNKEVDVEFGKHIFNVNPYRMTFYELFAGWREVDSVEDIEMFGKHKRKPITEMTVDYNSRIMNESGANYLFNAVKPLIGEASTSSKLSAQEIYNQWCGRLLTCRMTMLSQYYFPKLRCMEGTDRNNGITGCEYITENSASLREHFRTFGHSTYTKMINAYGLDVDRYPEAAVTLCNMSTITWGGLEGFKTKQITEHYVSTNQSFNGNPYGMMPQQGGGIWNTLMGRGGQQQMR